MANPTYYDHLDDAAIDESHLTPIVKMVLEDDSATITSWQYQLLKGIGGGVGGNKVLLFEGEAETQNGAKSWHVILKMLTAQSIDHPTGPHYWLREVEVYRSGFVNTLEGKLTVPHCYRIDQPADEVCWVWLQFVEETSEDRWTDTQFIQSARHLGQFNGHFLAQDKLPSYDWMSINWHGKNLDQVAPLVKNFKTAMSNRLYQLGYPDDSHTFLLNQWEKRGDYLDKLEPLPETICHYDAFRRNLLALPNETVAIDWTFVGAGPIGADVAAMLWVSFVFNNISAQQLDSLYEPMLNAYLQGLSDMDAEVDEKTVRLGYAASFVVRVLISAGYDTLLLLDESRHEHFEAIINMPIEAYMVKRVAAAQPIIQRIAKSVELL